MEELLRSLGIEPAEDAETIVDKLELKQSEIMERLDNVEDERRRQKLKSDLNQIAAAITAFSWMRGKAQTGIIREEDASQDNFSDLKNQPQKEKEERTITYKQEVKGEEAKSEEELYEEALAVMATPDYEKGVEMMRGLAERGYLGAQLRMAKMYYEGNRVQKDEAMAAQWYQKAAEQGNAEAQFFLGWMYDSGRGVPQNDGRAAAWYEKAAEQEHAGAQYNVGVMYQNGRGVLMNYEKAAGWFEKAAYQGLSLKHISEPTINNY